ncbi:MAG TPA: alpha/beta hydrolase [Taishania sp.]|nr:alpha/beta hydrolase [Taishania sp.]
MLQLRYLNTLLLIGVLTLFSCKKDKEENKPAISSVFNAPYGTDPLQKMDIYLPNGRNIETTKSIIFVHGGNWSSGDKNDITTYLLSMRELMPDYAFFSINYRLFQSATNENQFPTQEEDLNLALNYILAHTAGWEISNKFVLMGIDAGAQLALLKSYKNNVDNYIKAVIAYAPITDFTADFSQFPITQNAIESVTGGTPAIYQQANPINFVNSAIPTLVFHGTADQDVPITQSYLLVDSLVSNNIPNSYWYVNSSHHFDNLYIRPSIEKMKLFLDQHVQ